MLDMDSRRLGYSDQLRPERGFEVVYAVGTTYSLDMAAMLNVALTLGLGEAADTSMQNNHVCLLAAVERLRGKMTVFCEQGRIKVGAGERRLCTLLEDMIVPVAVNRANVLASFHPKVWIVEYANPSTKERKWRLIVLSRNLTFDSSWDVAVRLDGTPTGAKQKGAAPVADFLRFLARITKNDNADAQSAIRKMANRLQNVRFEVDSQVFDDFEFLPFGPGLGKASQSALFTTHFDRAIVVSPFLSNSGPLEILSNNRTSYGEREGEFVLIARDYQLARLSPEILARYSLYIPDPILGSVELDDGAVAADYAELHAKIYFTEANSDRNLYIGSLNASQNGLRNNVECLARFHVKKRKLTFAELMRSLVGLDAKERRPFAPILSEALSQQDFPENEKQLADSVLHQVAKILDIRAVKVESAPGGAYAIECSVDFGIMGDMFGVRVEIAPYLAQSTRCKMELASQSATYRFAPLEKRQISAFFLLEAIGPDEETASCVVKCPLDRFDDDVAPRLDRTRNLLGDMLDSHPSALPLYVDMAFCTHAARAGSMATVQAGRASSYGSTLGSGLYERLLVVSREEPQMLASAKMLMNLIPDHYDEARIKEMRELIEVFEKAVGKHATRRV